METNENKNLSMINIYGALEWHHDKAAKIEEAAQKKIDEIERKIYVLTSEYNKKLAELNEEKKTIEERLNKAKGNKESLAMTMECLSSMDGDFNEDEENEIVDEDETKQETVEVKKEVPKLEWKHKTAILVKYAKDGTVLGRYNSQKQLANQLRVSPQTVGYILKKDKDAQIKKYGFSLGYEY